jgi:hypothetical protein
MSENERWRRLADRLEARPVAGEAEAFLRGHDAVDQADEAERVLRRDRVEALADEWEMLGRVVMPPPPGHEDDPEMSLDEQLADPEIRAHLGLPPCGCTPDGDQ